MFQFSLHPDGGDISQVEAAAGSRLFIMTVFMFCTFLCQCCISFCDSVIDEQNDCTVGDLLKMKYLHCLNGNIIFLPPLGTNQQFGEPGVWPSHVKERRWRRCSCCRRRRGGSLSWPQPCQSIAGQARSSKARHRGGVPGTPVVQPHPQGCSCVLRGRLNIATLCAVPTSHPNPPKLPHFFTLSRITINPSSTTPYLRSVVF